MNDNFYEEIINEYLDQYIEGKYTLEELAVKLKKENEITNAVRTIRYKLADAIERITGKRPSQLKIAERADEILSQEFSQEVKSNLDGSVEYITNKTPFPIKSEEDAIKYYNIDKSKYDIAVQYKMWTVTNGDGDSYLNHWSYVKTFPRFEAFNYEKAFNILDEKLKSIPAFGLNKQEGNKEGVLFISDIHVGAKVNESKGVIKTKDYNYNILLDYLEEAVTLVNNLKLAKVTVCFLGDLFETISGINHLSSWQELEEDGYGSNAVITGHKVLSKFLSSISNLDKVYMVSGNHDRIHNNKDVDPRGEGGKLVAYMLERDFNVQYHPLITSFIVDNISYIGTHGNYRLSKKPATNTILNYGKQGLYNVLAEGHLHTRKKKIREQDMILEDMVNYRQVVIPPIFTGNFFAESLGYTSSAGVGVFVANSRKDNVHYYDFGL